jgi:hypothetical protein
MRDSPVWANGASVSEALSQRGTERPFRGLVKFGGEHQEIDAVEVPCLNQGGGGWERRHLNLNFSGQSSSAETDGIAADNNNALLFSLALGIGNLLYELRALYYCSGERCQERGPWWQRLGVERHEINKAMRLQCIGKLGPEPNDEVKIRFVSSDDRTHGSGSDRTR